MVQNTAGAAVDNDVFTGYGANALGSFGDFNKDGRLNGQTIATASFSFNVYGANYAYTTDVSPLYTLSGSVSLGFDANGNIVEISNVSSAQGVLNNFQAIYQSFDSDGNPLPLSNTDNIAGFQWDETPIDVTFPDPLTLVGGGQGETSLYYRATSSVDISVPCVSATECLVAYSGFGDPVGRGGGVSDFADFFQALDFDASSSSCPDDNSQICFSPQNITPFSINAGGVPEPASWTLAIMGFGLAGAALRRRRVLSYS
ncbi:MAG: PEP-CTERM sorting domain-containing protein [Proteobacteria bacterium]|nr:PEP-CTERM sorting domain-containing protein [Pseudomonadota bacterium]